MVAPRPAQHALLDCYAALHRTSVVMLAAARAADWRAVGRGEIACLGLRDTIAAFGDPPAALDEDGRRQRVQILAAVMVIDAVIRDLACPWLRDAERHVYPSSSSAARPPFPAPSGRSP